MHRFKNLLLIIISIFITIAFLELFLFFTERNNATQAGIVGYHELLGWSPLPGATGFDRHDNPIHILPDGTRKGGNHLISDRLDPILVVGDSFVFGDEVADHETWPSYLEKILNKPVLNAGVNGYGIDQSVLRAEEIMKTVQPSLLIFGLFPDDIVRCGLSMRYAHKPYFDVENDALELKNVPVPQKSLLQKTLLGSRLLKRAFPKLGIVKAHDDHERVASLLLKRVADKAKQKSIPIVFVVQYNDLTMTTKENVDNVLSLVKDDGYSQIIDLFYPLRELNRTDFNRFVGLFYSYDSREDIKIRHMNSNGNYFIAQFLKDNLNIK